MLHISRLISSISRHCPHIYVTNIVGVMSDTKVLDYFILLTQKKILHNLNNIYISTCTKYENPFHQINIHVTLLLSTSPCYYPQHPVIIHVTLLLSTSPCYYPRHPVINHVTLLLSTSPCYYPRHPVIIHVTLLLSTSPCYYPRHPVIIHVTLLLTTSPCY